MVLPVGAEYHDQRLIRVRRKAAPDVAEYETDELAWVRFVPLVAGLPRFGDHASSDAGETQDDLAHDEFAVE